MTKRELNLALNKHKELRKQIDELNGVCVTKQLKVLVCSGKCAVSAFNLRDINKDIIK